MNVLRYGLMALFLIGYTYDSYTNSEIISNQSLAIPTTFSVKDAYVSASAKKPASILKKESKPKVEGRRISIAPQASTRRISNEPETSDFEHVPVDYAAEPESFFDRFMGKNSNVNFNVEPEINEPIVDKLSSDRYHTGRSSTKFGKEIFPEAVQRMSIPRQFSAEMSKFKYQLADLYDEGADLGQPVDNMRYATGGLKWKFPSGETIVLPKNPFDKSGKLTFETRDYLARKLEQLELRKKELEIQERIRQPNFQSKQYEPEKQLKESKSMSDFFRSARTKAQEAYRKVKGSLPDESHMQQQTDSGHGW